MTRCSCADSKWLPGVCRAIPVVVVPFLPLQEARTFRSLQSDSIPFHSSPFGFHSSLWIPVFSFQPSLGLLACEIGPLPLHSLGILHSSGSMSALGFCSLGYCSCCCHCCRRNFSPKLAHAIAGQLEGANTCAPSPLGPRERILGYQFEIATSSPGAPPPTSHIRRATSPR